MGRSCALLAKALQGDNALPLWPGGSGRISDWGRFGRLRPPHEFAFKFIELKEAKDLKPEKGSTPMACWLTAVAGERPDCLGEVVITTEPGLGTQCHAKAVRSVTILFNGGLPAFKTAP